MVRIPIVSDLISPQKKQDTQEQNSDTVRLSGTIPTQQAGQPPSFDVVKEAAKTNQVSAEWKKKYRGFDLDNAAPFGNIPYGHDEIKRMEFEIQQEVLANYTPVDSVFDDDYSDRRLDVIQDGVLVQQQYSKAVNSNLLNRALGTYSNMKTEIQAGGIQKQNEVKGGLKSFLFR